MGWTIKFEKYAAKQLKKLDKQVAKKILDYLRHVSTLADPKTQGRALLGDKSGLWRYRIDNYRVICKIHNAELIVTVIRIGHRKNVYRK